MKRWSPKGKVQIGAKKCVTLNRGCVKHEGNAQSEVGMYEAKAECTKRKQDEETENGVRRAKVECEKRKWNTQTENGRRRGYRKHKEKKMGCTKR